MTSAVRRRILLYVPLGLAAAAGGGFYAMLQGLRTGDYDPRGVPSALIGRPVPEFAALPPLEGAGVPPFSSADLRTPDRPVLVNFWASWCVPCRQEHPVILSLSKDPRLTVVGVNYKDGSENALRFLGELGNPFSAIGLDPVGKMAIDWGVYGIPESYLVGPDGTILYKKVGPFDDRSLKGGLYPAIEKALGTPAAAG